MNRLLPFVLTGALVLAVACSGSSSDDDPAINTVPTLEVVDGKIILPQSAVTDMARGYRFTSELDLSTTEEELTVHFEGASQAPDSIQGTMRVSAAPYSELGDFGLTVVGEYLWLDLDGEWQSVEQDRDMVHPLVMFRNFATPQFYLEALRFDWLALPVSGPAEMVNGVEAVPVRLLRQDIVDVLAQGTELRTYPEASAEYTQVPSGVGSNLEQLLPENFAVEVWFAERGGVPIRIAVSYDITEDDPTHLSLGLGDLLSVRLQMDITDVDPSIRIEPPDPVPTSVVAPTMPRGELTANQRARIAEIAANDPAVQEIIEGGSIALAHEVWRTADLEVLGGYLYVTFIEPRSYRGRLPSIIYDESETTRPPFTEIETDVQLDNIERLRVLVYLREERVVQIEVVDADAGE